MDKIACILVTYNRLELLKEALEALEQLEQEFTLFIVDNHSTDDTPGFLKNYVKKSPLETVLITTEKNLGGAGGFYTGMKEAYEMGYDLFWLMDDDTLVEKQSLKALLDARKADDKAAFYSSKAIWVDGNPNRMNAQRLLEKDDDQPLVRAREATFVSFLTSRSQIEKKGYPIAEFFIWGDDIEYSRRLSKDGYGLVVRDSKVLHKTKTNTGSDISRDEKERLGRYFYAYRNEVFMARNEGGIRIPRQLLKILYHSARVLLLSSDKRKRLGIIWSSSRKGLSFNPQIEIPDA